MPDWGQYTEKQVMDSIRPRKGSGTCERCGKPTRTKTIFGMTICHTRKPYLVMIPLKSYSGKIIGSICKKRLK